MYIVYGVQRCTCTITKTVIIPFRVRYIRPSSGGHNIYDDNNNNTYITAQTPSDLRTNTGRHEHYNDNGSNNNKNIFVNSSAVYRPYSLYPRDTTSRDTCSATEVRG